MTFAEIYKSRSPVISLEFFPPRSAEQLPQTMELIRELGELRPQFMTVTYGAGGGNRALTRALVEFIRTEVAIPSVAHLTCAGHSREELSQIIEEFRSSGIEHLLALRGDPPKGASEFVVHPGGFRRARELVELIAATGGFSTAVAGYPETHREACSSDADLRFLKEKVDAGAEVIFTQLFFDADIYFRFVERARAAGITVPIVPGVMPIANVSQTKRFTQLCGASIPPALQAQLDELDRTHGDVVAFGLQYAQRLCDTLLEGGAPGIHLYTLNRSVQAKPIVQALLSRPLTTPSELCATNP